MQCNGLPSDFHIDRRIEDLDGTRSSGTCGKETVRCEIFREDSHAVAQCSSCGLKEEFPVKHAQGEVDVYCMLTDRVYGSIKRTPVTNVKKE